ncbi:MAG: phytoene/squalene synthase family protein [Phycisphaerales bacterium]
MSILAECGPAPVQTPSLTAASAQAGTLGRSFERCRDITRARARNFYHGLRLTPEPKRAALYAIYAWMREADDIADDTGTGIAREVRLETFTARTHAAIAGDDVDGDWWPAFATTYRAFALRPEPFERTLEGVRKDIEGDAHAGPFAPVYEDTAGLERYCEHVASTVGVLCLRIWGVERPDVWPEAHRLAIRRGVAFQLTNILRDVREDAGEGRCYVPASMLNRHGISAETLRDWGDPAACDRVVGDLVEWARREYDASSALDALVHPDGKAPMWAMTRIYNGLLERIAQDPARTALGPRVRLPGTVKIGIALRAAMRARRAG